MVPLAIAHALDGWSECAKSACFFHWSGHDGGRRPRSLVVRARVIVECVGMRRQLLTIISSFMAIAAIACLNMGPTKEALQQPPCGSTTHYQRNIGCPMIGSSAPQIQNVALCDLLHDPDSYMQKVVQVRAIFYSDAGGHSVDDPACGNQADQTQRSRLLADFDRSYGIQAEAEQSVDDFLCQASHYHWNKKVDMTLVGRLERRHDRVEFIIMCIEQARPVEPKV